MKYKSAPQFANTSFIRDLELRYKNGMRGLRMADDKERIRSLRSQKTG